MQTGFVPALGTPLDQNGNLMVESYKRQIEDQISAGAIGLLCMGSMGQQAFIRQAVCVDVAKAAVEAAAGRVPVYVGVMDCSIHRAKERMEALKDLDIAGFVFTAPYYAACTRAQMMTYFKGVAAATDKPILLYDLPSVTQSKITYDMVLELIRDVPNLKGMKSADTVMFRKLLLNPQVPKDFVLVYSGLDMFDIAYKWGINKCLDGMMSCTPVNSKILFDAMKRGDFETAAIALDNITTLRDFFLARELWAAFSTAMNLLGYEGNFAPDYIPPIKEQYVEEVKAELIRIGELSV